MSVDRWAVKVFLLAALAGGAAAFSCKSFDLPDEICNARDLKGPLLSSRPNPDACTRCLEDQCCDAVGACQRKDNCFEMVRSVHECVLSKGPAAAYAESECATTNGLDREAGIDADDTYRCMRERCGEVCGLPVCRVNPAGALIQTAKCDQCFSSSCCAELNACYMNRACKLTLECVSTKCGGVLAMNLREDAQTDGGFRVSPPDDAEMPMGMMMNGLRCADGGVAGSGGVASAPTCVQQCLCEFADSDPGLEPLDMGVRSFALAGRVYECGVRANCADSCELPAADASRGD